jgi:hypothetical protein
MGRALAGAKRKRCERARKHALAMQEIILHEQTAESLQFGHLRSALFQQQHQRQPRRLCEKEQQGRAIASKLGAKRTKGQPMVPIASSGLPMEARSEGQGRTRTAGPLGTPSSGENVASAADSDEDDDDEEEEEEDDDDADDEEEEEEEDDDDADDEEEEAVPEMEPSKRESSPPPTPPAFARMRCVACVAMASAWVAASLRLI